MQEFDYIVIGSGPGGQRAAIQAAKIGKRVGLVEKRFGMGGVSINTGTIPSKTLREAVIDLSALRRRALYGDSIAGGAEITIEDLLLRTGNIMRLERDVVRTQLARNHVQVIEGTARFASPRELDVEGATGTHRIGAPTIVIAVGSRPGVPRESRSTMRA